MVQAGTNGSHLSGGLVSGAAILPGGSPRDGIPAIDAPHLVAAVRACRLTADGRILGVTAGGRYRAYPFVEFVKAAVLVVEQVAGHTVTVHYDPPAPAAWAEVDGRDVAATRLFWSAWSACHPETSLFRVSPTLGRGVSPSWSVGAEGEP